MRRSRAFIHLTVAFSVAAVAAYAVLVTLVPLLTERGVDPGAALAPLTAAVVTTPLGGYPATYLTLAAVTLAAVLLSRAAIPRPARAHELREGIS